MNLILLASGAVTGLLVGLTGVGHLLTGNVDFGLLGNLLLGSMPAAIAGAMLSWVPAAPAATGHTFSYIAFDWN